MNIIKESATSFSSFILNAVNLLLLKKIIFLTVFKIITVSRKNIIYRVFLMGRSKCPTREENCGSSPRKRKTFLVCWLSAPNKKVYVPCPFLITDQTLWKKVSPIAFRQIAITLLPSAAINSPSSPETSWETKGMGGKSYQTAEIYIFVQPEKKSLNKFNHFFNHYFSH